MLGTTPLLCWQRDYLRVKSWVQNAFNKSDAESVSSKQNASNYSCTIIVSWPTAVMPSPFPQAERVESACIRVMLDYFSLIDSILPNSILYTKKLQYECLYVSVENIGISSIIQFVNHPLLSCSTLFKCLCTYNQSHFSLLQSSGKVYQKLCRRRCGHSYS